MAALATDDDVTLKAGMAKCCREHEREKREGRIDAAHVLAAVVEQLGRGSAHACEVVQLAVLTL
jgi:hypothetical protein